MDITIDSGMESVREKRREFNTEIMPQSTALYKELLKAKDRPNPNHLILRKQLFRFLDNIKK